MQNAEPAKPIVTGNLVYWSECGGMVDAAVSCRLGADSNRLKIFAGIANQSWFKSKRSDQ